MEDEELDVPSFWQVVGQGVAALIVVGALVLLAMGWWWLFQQLVEAIR